MGGTDSHQGTLQTKGVSKETGTADMGTDMGMDMERGPSKFKDVVVAIFVFFGNRQNVIISDTS